MPADGWWLESQRYRIVTSTCGCNIDYSITKQNKWFNKRKRVWVFSQSEEVMLHFQTKAGNLPLKARVMPPDTLILKFHQQQRPSHVNFQGIEKVKMLKQHEWKGLAIMTSDFRTFFILAFFAMTPKTEISPTIKATIATMYFFQGHIGHATSHWTVLMMYSSCNNTQHGVSKWNK